MRRIIQSFIFIIAASISLGAHAADFATRTYPLSIDVEGKSFQSALYLRLQVKDYGLPFAEFVKGEHDPYEATFIAFVSALQNDDRQVAEKLFRPARRAATKSADVTVSELSPADAVTAYRKAFADMKDIEVVSQVLVGSEHIFVWESHAAAAASRARNGVIVDGTPDALTVRGVNSNDPLSVLIVYSVMDAMRQAPQAYRVLSARTTAFEYALPVAGAPVVMQFDGALAGASRSAMAVSGTPAAEILRLYADTAEALRLRATDQFLAKFTPPSAEKMKQYLAAVTEAQYDALAELAWQKKHVQLVMGSDPVYIVYYTIGDDPEYRYNYVARDAATRQLRFANINRRWLLDHVLSRPELFDVSRVVGQQAPAAR